MDNVTASEYYESFGFFERFAHSGKYYNMPFEMTPGKKNIWGKMREHRVVSCSGKTEITGETGKG